MPSKTVLITGCSDGGIGASLAHEFHSRGFRVFASLRNRSKAASLSGLDNVEIIELDVVSKPSIAAAFELVKARTGGKLDILINNSGLGAFMPLLDADMDKSREIYEVNVWAPLAMTQAFASLLLAAQGTVVNISSIAGLVNSPYSGVYNSSKAAITSLSETLRLELEPLGVRVVCVQTGVIKTNFAANTAAIELPKDSFYNVVKPDMERSQNGAALEKGVTPEKFAKELTGDILGGSAGFIWRGSFSGVARFMTSYAPSALLDKTKRDQGNTAAVAKAFRAKV